MEAIALAILAVGIAAGLRLRQNHLSALSVGKRPRLLKCTMSVLRLGPRYPAKTVTLETIQETNRSGSKKVARELDDPRKGEPTYIKSPRGDWPPTLPPRPRKKATNSFPHRSDCECSTCSFDKFEKQIDDLVIRSNSITASIERPSLYKGGVIARSKDEYELVCEVQAWAGVQTTGIIDEATMDAIDRRMRRAYREPPIRASMNPEPSYLDPQAVDNSAMVTKAQKVQLIYHLLKKGWNGAGS